MNVRDHKVQPSDVKVEFVGEINAERQNVKKSFVKDKFVHEVAV